MVERNASRSISMASSGEKEPSKVLNIGGSQFATVSDYLTHHLGLQMFIKSTDQIFALENNEWVFCMVHSS